MRHFNALLVGGVVLATIVTGCVLEPDNQETEITSVRCSISQIDVEEDFATGALDTLFKTKATISGANFLWSAGDKIGILPNAGAQIYFAVDDGAGTSTASFDGGDWAMKSTGTFYAYYPLYPDIFLSKDHVPVSYIGQSQSGNNNNLHTGDFWTLYTEGTTAVGNTLNFTFNHLTSFFKTYVTVPAGTYTRITFSAPSAVFIKDGYFDLSAPTPTIVGTTFIDELSLNLQGVTFADDTELTGYLVLAPVDITGVPITVTVYKDDVAAYEYTLTKAAPMVAAKTYAFRATALTQLASSPSQANALFAAGATAVSITEPLANDATIVLPNTSESVTLTLPATASSSKLTVTYDPGAVSYPTALSISGPEGADLDIQTPNSTVTVNGVAYDQITSRTAANTCIIPIGVAVNILKVLQGSVQVFGTVSQIDLSEQEDHAIISVSGTVATLLGEDDEEYTPVSGVSLNKSSIALYVGFNENLTATVTPVGAYPYVIWTSSDDAVATVSSSGVVSAVSEGTATITARTISGGYVASCIVTVDALEYVDLGLSVKWAKNNLGASSPEGFGDYYAWGETETKMTYSWESYSFGTNPFSEYNLSVYGRGGFIDNKKLLNEDDDVAHILLGGSWRMPTEEEIAELCDGNKCTWSWTSENGISGCRITSRIAGYTDQSIFLPAASIQDDAASFDDAVGGYWALSIGSSQDRGRAIYFNMRNRNYGWGDMDRYYGMTIRPVYGARIPTTGVSLNHSSITISVGDTENLICAVSPANAFDKGVLWASGDSYIASVTQTGVVTAVSPGTVTITVEATDGSGCSDECIVTVVEDPNNGLADLGEHTFVDMGLSVKWATCNLGASQPEEYGDYYAWGESKRKVNYSYDTYKWFNYSDGFTKYNTNLSEGVVDNKTALDNSDDAARVIWGGTWRMPTSAELDELLNQENCNWLWTTENGVYGFRVTSKKPGYTDRSIFLPAAGFKDGTGTNSSGTGGYYWSSSLSTPWLSYVIWFGSSYHFKIDDNKSKGLSIRPVKD